MSWTEYLSDSSKQSVPHPNQNRTAIGFVEDVNDPTGSGRVKVRIVNHQTTNKTSLSTDKLVWIKTRPTNGTSGGKGESINWMLDQAVTLEATDDTLTDWIIIGGSTVATNRVDSESDTSFGGKAKGDDKRINEEIDSPAMSTGDVAKLATTGYAALQAGLTLIRGDKTKPLSPPVPPPAGVVSTQDLDWSTNATVNKIATRYGLELGNLFEAVKVDGKQANSKLIKITLINESNGYPGGAIGRSTDGLGTKIGITYINNNLKVPTLVPPGEYIIRFNVEYLPFTQPIQEAQVKIKVVDLPSDIPEPLEDTTSNSLGAASVAAQPVDPFSAVSEINIVEPTIDATKGRVPYVKTYEYGGITEYKDSTEGNISWSTTVNHGYSGTQEKRNNGEQDPEKFSTIIINPEGKVGLKSSDDMILISNKNLQMYIKNTVEQKVEEMFKLIAKDIQIKAGNTIRVESGSDAVIDIGGNATINVAGTTDITSVGNINVTTPTMALDGNLTVSGTIVSEGEVTGNSVTLSGHIHKEPSSSKWKDSSAKTTTSGVG